MAGTNAGLVAKHTPFDERTRLELRFESENGGDAFALLCTRRLD